MTATEIVRIHGRRVWDSRGRPTVEAEITLSGGALGRAIAPAGASTGSGEALDLRDGGRAFGGFGVDRAVAFVGGEIAKALAGRDANDQAGLDAALLALDGTAAFSRIGANAALAVSLAAADAASKAAGLPLWAYLAGGTGPVLPTPEIQIFGGGAHAEGRLDLQDLMVVPYGARSFAEACAWTAEIYRAAGALMSARGARYGVADEGGWWPAFASNEAAIETLLEAIARAGFSTADEVGVSIDVAATQLYRDGRYHLACEARSLSPEDWLRTLLAWCDRYPILMVEDPFEETDLDAHAALTAEVGDRMQVIGDDLLTTNRARIEAAAAAAACNTLLCKPNQVGTLSLAKAALQAARAAGWGVVVSARSGESEDVSLAHLAVGWAAGQIKVGSFARSERMAKWNELIRIEEALGASAAYSGGAPFGRY